MDSVADRTQFFFPNSEVDYQNFNENNHKV